MNNKMLIDASHPEETRVVVLRDGRIEEFDYESAAKKLLRGNIYLAKVTRVEPSLQAAFVDYGGNRHGFLAFNEIHPDYYQIPVADRQALVRAEVEAARRDNDDGGADEAGAGPEHGADAPYEEAGGGSVPWAEEDGAEPAPYVARQDEPPGAEPMQASETAAEAGAGPDDRSAAALDTGRDSDVMSWPIEASAHGDRESEATGTDPGPGGDADLSDAPRPIGLVENEGVEEVPAENGNGEPEKIESVGSEDALEEVPERRRRSARPYKIQEVVRRRQILLVQVVKEERGNKGAALTTYLSLAGRYTVLMPNTGRGGGISRKITNAVDRKRLKEMMSELEVPEGMGLIVRTAGASRTKAEIKRDFEYLLRVWESVRELTLKSTAPALVYEEGDLIKRSIRDLYSKDIEEIVVAGDAAFNDARDFMRMLMPSHSKNVRNYDEPEPIFTRFQIERQLNAMFSPHVTLRSGGYLVINQTEALVAIDINSGRSTREHSIEDTALKTNTEAAEEIARQLRLRDLAGLIVIDFIDMEERRNNRTVERKLKDALRFDRARIQVGRISHFGLLEMSRQRLRTGVLEGSTSQCPHCLGTGVIRSTESVALAVLRALEDALLTGQRNNLTANTSVEAALYLLNSKRSFLKDMEDRHDITITVNGTEEIKGANFTIERSLAAASPAEAPRKEVVQMDWAFDESQPETAESEADRKRGRKRKRRRGRGDRPEGDGHRAERHANGNGHGHPHEPEEFNEPEDQQPYAEGEPPGSGDQPDFDEDAGEAIEVIGGSEQVDEGEPRRERDGRIDGEREGGREGGRRRRRGRRGGKRNRRGPLDTEVPREAGDVRPGEDQSGAMIEAGPIGNGGHEPAAAGAYDQPVGGEGFGRSAAAEPQPWHAEPDINTEQLSAAAAVERYQRRTEEPVVSAAMPEADGSVEPEPHARAVAEAAPVPLMSEPSVVVIEETRPDPTPPRRGWWQRKLL